MNENLNLCEILKDCPKETKLWSPVCGDVTLVRIDGANPFPIDLTAKAGLIYISLRSNGKMYDAKEAECLLFPSKNQRDWSKFNRFWDKPNVDKFDVNTLQPFDKILARDNVNSNWECAIFSHIDNSDLFYPIETVGTSYNWCIPYNDKTKHLIGTTEDCPDYYKWWEE